MAIVGFMGSTYGEFLLATGVKVIRLQQSLVFENTGGFILHAVVKAPEQFCQKKIARFIQKASKNKETGK